MKKVAAFPIRPGHSSIRVNNGARFVAVVLAQESNGPEFNLYAIVDTDMPVVAMTIVAAKTDEPLPGRVMANSYIGSVETTSGVWHVFH